MTRALVWWNETELVNGERGLPLRAHVASLVTELGLTRSQAIVIANELRNALAPAAVDSSPDSVGASVERVIALADALAGGR